MKLGLEYGKVSLAPHDENWKVVAQETIGRLREILGETAISIQHVGSTSINGIPAKPIIDIAVGVKDPKCVYQFEKPLLEAGIHIVGELVPGQIMCDIKTPEGLEEQHIHFVIYDCQAWREYVWFRDYLNANPEQAKRYENLKLELVQKYANDRRSYTEGKAELITELLKKAEQWSSAGDAADKGKEESE